MFGTTTLDLGLGCGSFLFSLGSCCYCCGGWFRANYPAFTNFAWATVPRLELSAGGPLLFLAECG